MFSSGQLWADDDDVLQGHPLTLLVRFFRIKVRNKCSRRVCMTKCMDVDVAKGGYKDGTWLRFMITERHMLRFPHIGKGLSLCNRL